MKNSNEELSSNPILDELTKLYQDGRFDILRARLEKLLKTYPNSPHLWSFFGATNQKLGKISEASEAFEKVIALNPMAADAFNNLAVTLKIQGKLSEAIRAYKKAVLLQPNYPQAYYNMGITFQEQRNLDEAIVSYKNAIALKSDYYDAYNNLAGIYKNLGDWRKAIETYQTAYDVSPNSYEAINNLANIFQEKGDLENAHKFYQKAIETQPYSPEIYLNIGVNQKKKGNYSQAIEYYKKAIEINTNFPEAHYNLGIALHDLYCFNDALQAYQAAIKIKPEYPEAFLNIGNLLKQRNEIKDALQAYNEALTHKPDYPEAHYNIGIIFQDQNRPLDAIKAYNKAINLRPNYEIALAKRLHQQAIICDWNAIECDNEIISNLGIQDQLISPFSVLALEDQPLRHLLRAKIYANGQYGIQKKVPVPSILGKVKKLNIGFFSPIFHQNPVSISSVRVFELLDKDRFSIFAFCHQEIFQDDYFRRIVSAGVKIFDVSKMTDSQIVNLAREKSINIAVDFNGYLKNERSSIFTLRPAPIQINYLAYPGSLGADFIDYIVADKTVIPEEQRRNYLENIIYLPHSYLPHDNTRQVPKKNSSRTDYNLPEKAFVFCCFNNSFKISRTEFSIWMRILSEVKNSVLWLLESNRIAEENLKSEAKSLGVEPNRIIFAEKLPLKKHVTRLQLADLYLDTFCFNAHTSACDALLAGVPIISKLGQGFAARVASSLLNSMELPELIVSSDDEYEKLILQLAQEPKVFKNLKKKLLVKREMAPLFQTEKYTFALEKAFTTVYDRYSNRLPPEDLEIK